MDQETTLLMIGIGAVLTLAGIGGAALRNRAPLAWHAHVPWNGMAFAGVGLALVAAAHLLALFRAA